MRLCRWWAGGVAPVGKYWAGGGQVVGTWWEGAEHVLGWNIREGGGRAVPRWCVWDGILDVKDNAALGAACSGQRSAPR